MKGLPSKLKIFLLSIYILTAVSLFSFIKNGIILISVSDLTGITLFCILLALTESFNVSYKNMSISASFAIFLAILLLFKPLGSIIILIIGFSLRIIKYNNKYVYLLNTPVYKTLYNYCVLVLPFLYSCLIYIKLGGKFSTNNLSSEIPAIIIFCVVYFILNALITSVLYAIINNKNMLYFLMSNLTIGILSSLVMAPFGLLLAYMYNNNGFFGVLLIVFPLVLARYTFSLYLESKFQYIQTVDTLMRAMEARDKYTEGHSQRVAEISENIARAFKYNDSKLERLHMAALLHDVGKIGIDDNILNKPGRLTNEEYEIIKSHPEIGYNIIKDIKNLQDILPIIRNHHERYDGKGYPDGKSGNDLNLDVFIVQLADSIDAMSTDRPYRKALSEEEIMAEINKFSGSQFHPKVVDVYTKILEKHKEQKAV